VMPFGYPQIQISFAGLSWTGAMAPGVSTITAIDPSFDGDEFLTFAQGTFLRIHEARAAGRIDDIRPVVSETIWPSFRSAMAKKAPAVTSIEHATIYDARRDASVDTVTVRFAAKTAKRKKNDLVEDWTFQRPAVSGGQSMPSECPSCGAPLTLDENGGCRYCRVHVAGARGGWKLVKAVPPPAASRSGGGARLWLVFWIVFMILMTVVLPIGIIIAVNSTTNSAFDSFGINGSPTTLDGPAAKSATNENVSRGQSPRVTVGNGVEGDAELSGAVAGTFAGTTTTPGANAGACASRAQKVTGLTFAATGTVKDEAGTEITALSVTLQLPAGAKGPGTYDLGSKFQLSASATRTPPSPGLAPSQAWTAGEGTKATFALDQEGSGELTFTDLVPTVPSGDAFGKPLSGTITFTCS
jgi:hypothetical protein